MAPSSSSGIIIIDFETTSKTDLRECGAYAYAAHPSTRIVCMAWADVANGEPQIWTPGQVFPAAVAEAARRRGGLIAHHAMFEHAIWNGVLRRMVPGLPDTTPETWEDTMARAAYCGLPLSLEKAGLVAGLAEQKDAKAGRRIVKSLRKQAESDGGLFGDSLPLPGLEEYAAQDIRAEIALFAATRPLPKREQAIYLLDAKINARGIGLDVTSARAAKEIVLTETAAARRRLVTLTGGAVSSPMEVAALQRWLAGRGVHLPDLRANTVDAALRRRIEDEAAAEVLTIRAEAAGSAVAKLDTMLAYAEPDGRMRGLLQYYGAPATGRWAGRGVQPQNLPRPETVVDPEDFVRFKDNPGALSVLYDGMTPLALVKSALRCLLWAAPGRVLLRADFSAIEARVVFWLSGQQDALDLYRRNADIYCEMATRVFKRPITKADAKERFVGKSLVLGCGYGLGAAKFQATMRQFGHEMTEQEARSAVETYRETWASVPRAWAELERAAIIAFSRGGARVEALGGKVAFCAEGDTMVVRLPSGRSLYWRGVRWDPKEQGLVCARAVAGQGARGNTQRLYGGAILERISQATARDIMADAMLAAEANGMPVVLTVHDEIVCEIFANRANEDRRALLQIMSEAPRWAAGLPLAAEAKAERRYGK